MVGFLPLSCAFPLPPLSFKKVLDMQERGLHTAFLKSKCKKSIISVLFCLDFSNIEWEMGNIFKNFYV